MTNSFDSDAAGLTMHHAGSLASFNLEVANPANKISIRHDNAKDREIIIEIKGNTIESVAPSIEGTELWVRTMTGDEVFYDALTGIALSAANLSERNPHFWGK
jgi:hypothetical protein